jgi:hypothetical protein
MTATTVFVEALEAELFKLYAMTNLTEAVREYRAELANYYRAATGRYFAARFYY